MGTTLTEVCEILYLSSNGAGNWNKRNKDNTSIISNLAWNLKIH